MRARLVFWALLVGGCVLSLGAQQVEQAGAPSNLRFTTAPQEFVTATWDEATIGHAWKKLVYRHWAPDSKVCAVVNEKESCVLVSDIPRLAGQ